MEGMGDEQRLDVGTPGASARREAERKRARREALAPSRSRLLRFLLGTSAAQRRRIAEEQKWLTGGRGEELLAATLAKRCSAVRLLHDRRIPGRRTNIDHLAIAASGVYVIDAKRYRGKIEVRKPMFGAAKLTIAGRDRTKLLEGLTRQVGVVVAALAEVESDVGVHGCLCFLDPEGLLAESGLPAFRRLRINGYALYSPRRLAKRLNEGGTLSPAQADRLHAHLARAFPPA
jgi:hypothetical protein